MTQKKLVLGARLSEERQAELRRRFPHIPIADCAEEPHTIREAIADADYFYGMLRPEDFAAAEKLSFIQVPWHGVEGLQYPALVESGVKVANCRGMCKESMTEQLFGMIIYLLRDFADNTHAQAEREWRRPEGMLPLLSGKTIGFLGTGSIADYAVGVARAFGCRVVGCNRSGTDIGGYDALYDAKGLHDFLGAADIVVSTLPYTNATYHLMDAKAFEAMKDGAMFINIGRGQTVDEDALIAALESGKLSAAGLDVTSEEPLPREHPLWGAPNCFITPHTSGINPVNAQRGFEMLLCNLERLEQGQPLESAVDLVHGY